MKRLVLFLLVAVAFGIVYANNIYSVSTTGDKIGESYILKENDVCAFEALNNTNWELLMYTDEGELQTIKTGVSQTSFSFSVSLSAFSVNSGNSFGRFSLDGSSRVYFKGIVRSSIPSSESFDEVEIYLDVLPINPTSIEGSWINLAFDENDYPTAGSKFEVTFNMEETRQVSQIKVLESSGTHLGDEPRIDWCCYRDIYDFNLNDNSIIFDFEKMDWGVYLKFWIYNNWGGIEVNDAKPIFNTDYITDPELLARIEKYKDDDTGVAAPEVEDVKIVSDDETINISDPNNEILTIRLFDASGKQVPFEKSGNSISVGSLNAGLYVLVCQTSAKQIIHKIVIK